MKPSNKCRICRAPNRQFKTTCSIDCESILGEKLLAKKKLNDARKERASDKVRKEKLMSISDHLNLTQTVFNKYVNEKYKHMPCLACGKDPYSGVRHAAHFKSRGSNSFLRFHLWNVFPCCYSCNVEKGGNIHEYRVNLIKLIGIEKVEFLDNAPKSRKYQIEYLTRMRAIFAKKTRRLKVKP